MKIDITEDGKTIFWSSRRRKWLKADLIFRGFITDQTPIRVLLIPNDENIPFSVWQAYQTAKMPIPGYSYNSSIYLTIEGEGVNDLDLVKESEFRFKDVKLTDFCTPFESIKERCVDRYSVRFLLFPTARLMSEKYIDHVLDSKILREKNSTTSEAVFKDLSVLDVIIRESKKAYYWNKYKHIRGTIGKLKSIKKKRRIYEFVRQKDESIVNQVEDTKNFILRKVDELSQLFPGKTIRLNLDSHEWYDSRCLI